MIDGLPAFPDETPEPDWEELRVAAGGAMVTLRREVDSLTCVIWGNADEVLVASWNRFLWACAAAGDGAVMTNAGAVSASAFAQLAEIRPA
ncbi:hypothetical protein R5W24_001926 [Gemmata sp. JC717]|uniref:hypothetical protein n=1 Tax=Gemmata algarum TaxID=2975278 RepID=UPI0021BA3E85|nr:hypothetical protein [Gemmata algarum]MDY3552837.1 hypothetical protein [Gemmata algarum]